MKREDWNLWNNITFKTQGYRKNFDLINTNEKFITEYEGMISEIRIEKHLPPRPMGEYSFSIWNIGLGEKFDVDFDKLLKQHGADDLYRELDNMCVDKEFKINNYKKVVLVQTLVLSKEYRKRGVTEEFVEMLYSDFYDDDVAIILLVKPYQNNLVNTEYFRHKKVVVKETLNPRDAIGVLATEYYSLNEFLDNNDTELNEYKLFAVANRCGFQRINDSHLFLLSSKKVEERMIEKQKFSQCVETE
jgi:hypothetical protein